MPNWCSTDYVIAGDEKEISDLYDKLSSLLVREDICKNDFGKFWLGNVVGLFGGDYNKIYCRGSMSNLERISPTEIGFRTDTAWGDMPGVWDFVLKQYSSLKYYFNAEEGGCCYYATNDRDGKYFTDRFVVDHWGNEYKGLQTKDEVMKDVSERIQLPVDSWEDMLSKIKAFNTDNEDSGIYIHEIKEV